MRRKFYLLSVAMCLLILGACAKSEAMQSVLQDANASSTAAPARSVQIELATNYIGADTAVGTESGFYRVVPNAKLGSNILYTDYSSESTVYLCSDPNCTHSTDSCTSWLEASTAQIFTTQKADAIYLIMSKNSKQTLFRMDLDAANRTPVYTLESSESFQDAVAADGENLYIAISAIENDSSMPTKRLVRLNTQTGEATTLVEYGSQDWLFGAFQDKLLLLYYDGTYFTYRTFSVTNNAFEDVFSYGGDSISNSSFARPNGQYLYIFEPKDSSTASVSKLNMVTGERQELCESVPYFGSEPIAIGNFVDDYCFVSVYNPDLAYDSENRDFCYMLNCETGETFPITLGYNQGDIHITMEAIASAGDYYIVNCGSTSKSIVLTGTDGAQYQAEMDMIEYALIAKDDYLNNRESFIKLD